MLKFAPPTASGAKSERVAARKRSVVRREIRRLREMEEKCFGSRHGRHDFLEYLEEVFKCYRKWASAKTSYREAIIDEFDIRERSGKSLLRCIIDASSKRDDKTKSRWSQALRFANKHRDSFGGWGRGTPFVRFVRRHHGISGCSSAFVEEKRRALSQRNGVRKT